MKSIRGFSFAGLLCLILLSGCGTTDDESGFDSTLPVTGQTASYATGDDGDQQRGIAWPVPRFSIGAGAEIDCVTDKLTGLMWVRSPDGTPKTWAEALSYANNLSLCGHSDWRLPNRNELRSLVNYGQFPVSSWLNSQGFSTVISAFYWTSNTVAADTANGWGVILYDSFVVYDLKTAPYRALPVRSSQTTPWVYESQTGQTASYATGDDGELQNGTPWPIPRFSVGTGAEAACVTDNLTGLMWVKVPGSTTRAWADAVADSEALDLCGYTNWRLPNVNELASLVNAGQTDMASWLNGQGFSNVTSNNYWSSTTYASDAFYVGMSDGQIRHDSKISSYNLWPVRSAL